MGNNRRAAVIRLAVLDAGVPGGWLLGRNSSAADVASPSHQTAGDQGAVCVIAKFGPRWSRSMVPPRTTRGLGSGTIIESRGDSGTDEHVVKGAKSLQGERFDGTKLPAQVAGCDRFDVKHH
jgi:S1-C subfamily serine protease